MNRPELFTIPPHRAFADALVAGLLERFSDPMALAGLLLLLPNRRAVRTVTEAFVRVAADRGLLLPRMVPVGDIGDDVFERLLSGEEAAAPAVSSLRRRLELAKLVGALPGERRSAPELLRLGDALGETLDALLEEEVDPARLHALTVGDGDAELAAHWQQTLRYLDVIVAAWPPERARLGASDGRTRLAGLVDALIARWQARPPGPVIAAGIVSVTPAIGRLLVAVSRLPEGAVVLPGLDVDMDDDSWAAIRCRAASPPDPSGKAQADSEEHPQYALKLLLARLGAARGEVRPWPGGVDSGSPERTRLITAAMAPAAAIDSWAGRDEPALQAAFAGVTYVEAATPAEEAQAIALAFRQALETAGKTAALVTPDRQLARRVAAHCRRFGIEVDDTAGRPLSATPPGALASALVTAAAEGFAPAPLLAALKHPLVQQGDGRPAWLARARQLDRVLRGVRPPPGLDPVAERIDALRTEAGPDGPAEIAPADKAELADWWDGVTDGLEPMAAALGGATARLDRLAAALRVTLDGLAGDAAWAGPDGRALARLIEGVEADGGVLGPVELRDAPALWALLAREETVRPAWGGHPRLAILGPLEARLQSADLLILGGLNEGVWPRQPAPDPWLAPALRRALGLPGPERQTGLAAHDFVQAMGAREVLLTRARRDASAPTNPSRLWLRMTAYAGDALRADKELLAIAQRIDRPDAVTPASRPEPRPPADKRPNRLSVTEVDTLAADAFAFYARRILGLEPLDPLDQDPTPADKGTLVHGVLEDWVRSGYRNLDQLTQMTERMLEREGAALPLLRALWGPRARRLIGWAGRTTLDRLHEWRPIAAELRGEATLLGKVRLTGKVDRIDADGTGRLVVIDYKTGSPPSKKRMEAGFASQLGLLGGMAEVGGFRTRDGDPVPAGVVTGLAYWKLGGGTDPGEIRTVFKGDASVAEHVADVYDRAEALVAALLLGDSPFVPKRRPELSWSDYDRLARVPEWLGREDRR